ncbi:MAG: undecaprenyl-diphosphatase UppP [Anaerolineae bacterium]|jgi:undecaprenyl-diphosphatase|nr:undecaprenyl-diphosphatase UppP [Anaerolineae bacterium]MBT7071858.1 undecaprenyl-diphosphatase UppP [Anaerolineae bacterium]MBT7325408.1 undecaprenyl-diphosphatase UppP [Anaerolineae bacterium]
MNLLQAFFLGIVQGLTEFIPVSSTAHLLIGQELLGIPASDATFSFLVLVQWGTLISLFIYFEKDLLNLIKAFFGKPFSNAENRMAWYVIIATIPALLVGYFLKDALEELFRTPLLAAAIRLFAAAALLSLAEWLGKRSRTANEMTWLDALYVGLFQVFAVFPGASRSGSAIAGGMLRGFTREASARFAFLMSIPVMLAAGAYESLDLFQMAGLAEFIPALIVGFLTAAFVGWLAIRWLMAYLNKNSLYSFVIYCVALGSILLGVYFFS